MAYYVYPAVFHANSDNSYTVTFPDLEGCITEGKDLKEAMFMSENALGQWLEYLIDTKTKIPAASDIKHITPDCGEIITLVSVTVKESRAVRRTISIPKWLDDKASNARLSLSKVLQEALKQRFGEEL